MPKAKALQPLSDEQLLELSFPAEVELRCCHGTARELEQHNPQPSAADRLLAQTIKVDLGEGPVDVRVVEVESQERRFEREVQLEEPCPRFGEVWSAELESLADPARACSSCGYFAEVVE